MATPTNFQLNKTFDLETKDANYLFEKRNIPIPWLCRDFKSMTRAEATKALGYEAPSGGIGFFDRNGKLWQFRPWEPEIDAKGRLKKYLTPRGDCDAFLATHPDIEAYWTDLEALKARCITINGKPCVLIAEGGFKGLTGCIHGIPTVAIRGVWQGLMPKSITDLVPALKLLAEAGFNFIIVFDSDIHPKTVKDVKAAEKRLTEALKAYGCDVLSVTGKWNSQDGKGMDDFINNKGIEAFRAILMQAAPIGDETLDTGNERKGKQLPPPGEMAEELSEAYRDKLAWQSEYQLWLRYGAKHDGVWDIEDIDSVKGLIQTHLRSKGLTGFNAGYISSVATILQSDLKVSDWNEQTGLICLRDGVLNRVTQQLLPHAPGYRFTTQLPFKWADRSVGCEPIEEFLLKITGSQAIADVLLAFLAAIVTRRADLQRYLELIGGGGTGKSTVMALARALAGADNTVSSQLRLLESNQFETARFYGKLLALFPDSERWQGEVSVLKQLTGQDPVRYERKGVQQCKDFRFNGMVMLSANEPPESKDKTSGLERRKLTIPLTRRLPEYEGRNLIEEFEPYLPGLLKRVLDIKPEEVTRLVKFTDREVLALADSKWEQMLITNDIARWLDDKAVLDPDLITYVGTNDETKAGSWLYASYCVDRQEQNEKPVSMKAFRPNLMDFLLNQLKVQVESGEDRKGRFIKGIGLRCHLDPTGEIYPRPVTKKPFGGGGLMVDGGGCVVAESIGSGGWDGCDGLIEGSENTENTQPATPPTSTQNQSCGGTGEHNPPHPPNPPLAGVPATTNPPQARKNPSHPDTIANQLHAELLADKMREVVASANQEAASEIVKQVDKSTIQIRGFFWQNLDRTNEKSKARLLVFTGLQEGTKLKYVGTKYTESDLEAYDADGLGGCCCRRPDGTLTTWIPLKDLRKL